MVRQLQRERTKERNFEPLSENSESRSCRNVWKTVPEAASGNWKSSVADSY